MAKTVTFRSIPRDAVLNQADYEWVLQHLGTPLPLFQITFDANGEVTTFAIHKEDSCISVFMLGDIDCDIELPSTIHTRKGKHVKIHCQCVRCGKTKVLKVSAEGARIYKAGLSIQRAFPELSEDEREWLISKVCPVCWEVLTT